MKKSNIVLVLLAVAAVAAVGFTNAASSDAAKGTDDCCHAGSACGAGSTGCCH